MMTMFLCGGCVSTWWRYEHHKLQGLLATCMISSVPMCSQTRAISFAQWLHTDSDVQARRQPKIAPSCTATAGIVTLPQAESRCKQFQI